MRELERQTEIDQTYIEFLNALEDYAKSDFDDFWKKDVQYNKYVTLGYKDAYSIEDIWFEVIKTYSHKNQDKPTAYIEIDMSMSDMQEEFFSAAALTQDDMFPDIEDIRSELYEKYPTGVDSQEQAEIDIEEWIAKEEEKDYLERDKWQDQTPLEGSTLNEAIEITPKIETRTCYNNMTHTHFHRAINIKARVYTTIELEKLKSLMETREFFYSLGFNHFST